MATFSFTVVVNGPASASLVFTPVQTAFTSPVPAGTVVGSVAVGPPDWSGVLSVDGPFVMIGNNVVVGDVPLTAGTYAMSGTATP